MTQIVWVLVASSYDSTLVLGTFSSVSKALKYKSMVADEYVEHEVEIHKSIIDAEDK